MKKVDLYTKVVLTVIAVSLAFIAINNTDILPKANAQTSTSVSTSGVMNVNVVSFNGSRVRISPSGSLVVDVQNTPEVKLNTGYSGLDVNVKNEVKLSTGYGGLSVNVTNYSDFK